MSDLIYGRNPVLSCLSGNRPISRVIISKSINDGRFETLCKSKNIKIQFSSNEEMNKLVKGMNHQGVICYLGEFEYFELEELLLKLKNKQNSLIVMLDGIEDPVNFGSIIRTSSCFDVDGIIIGKNRQVQMTPVVSKVATGAEEFVPIVRVTNLTRTIDSLKQAGYWILSTDGYAKQMYTDVDYRGKMCIVIGSEGRGISRLVLDNSDYVVKIPISGPITSLNASISCAIVLAQAINSRLKK